MPLLAPACTRLLPAKLLTGQKQREQTSRTPQLLPTLAGLAGGPQLPCLAQELLEGDVALGMVTGRREVLEGI